MGGSVRDSDGEKHQREDIKKDKMRGRKVSEQTSTQASPIRRKDSVGRRDRQACVLWEEEKGSYVFVGRRDRQACVLWEEEMGRYVFVGRRDRQAYVLWEEEMGNYVFVGRRDRQLYLSLRF